MSENITNEFFCWHHSDDTQVNSYHAKQSKNMKNAIKYSNIGSGQKCSLAKMLHLATILKKQPKSGHSFLVVFARQLWQNAGGNPAIAM
jgi:hypothetical protein